MENGVLDSESYSDFEASQAPQWSVRVKMVEKPACLLNEHLSEFIQLCSSNRSMQDLLGGLVDRRNLGKNGTYFNQQNDCCLYAVTKYFFAKDGEPTMMPNI